MFIWKYLTLLPKSKKEDNWPGRVSQIGHLIEKEIRILNNYLRTCINHKSITKKAYFKEIAKNRKDSLLFWYVESLSLSFLKI